MLTTVIGSYPLSYDKLGKEAILRSVQDQLDAGIDLVSDGQTRFDMIQYFAHIISGFTFDGKSVIKGQIGGGTADILLEDLIVAHELAPRVKGIIVGPMTLVLSSRIKGFYEGYRDEKVYLDAAKALLGIAQELEKHGADWIQIDEPYLSVGAPMAIAKKAIESIAMNLKVPVAVHVCGKVDKIIDTMLDLQGVSMISHGFMGEDNRDLLKYPKLIESKKLLGLGTINTKKFAIESPQQVKELIAEALKTLPPERLVIHPDCGFSPLDRESAFAKMKSMTAGLKMIGG